MAAPRLLDRYRTHRDLSVVDGDAHVWNVLYPRDASSADVRLIDGASILWQLTTPVWQAEHNIPASIWWSHLERILLAVDDLNCRELLG